MPYNPSLSGKPLVTGHLRVCLCISLVPDFIEVNAAARAAARIIDRVELIAILNALVSSSQPSSSAFRHYVLIPLRTQD
jgi:hypothetical protein